MSNSKPRYGKEVQGKLLKILSRDGKRWRLAAITGFHGGYLRHTVTFDDNNESRQMQLYLEEYKFLSEDDTGPMPDLLQRSITVQSPTGQRVTGEVIGYDGLMHTVRLADGSLQHFNLQQQPYKFVQENDVRDSTGRGSGRMSEPATSVDKAGSQQQQDSGGPVAIKKQKQQTCPSTSAGLAGGSAKTGSVQGSKDKKASDREVGSSVKADGSSKPPRRAAADRAAAVAVAVAMGSSSGNQIRDDDKSVSRRTAVALKNTTTAPAAGAGASKRSDVVVEVGKKLPPLNMSHVSKKDREAARMLLTFSTPHGQEAQASPRGLSTMPRAAFQAAPEVTSSRMAIAAAAQAAAAAAGLPDPAAGNDDNSLASPMDLSLPELEQPLLAITLAVVGNGFENTEDGFTVSRPAGSPDASAAADAAAPGSTMDQAVVTQVLTSLQWQMQKLTALEERRSVDLLRLNAKVARLQGERDDSFRDKETAVAARDAALLQVQQLQGDNTKLSTRVDILQREVIQMQAQLSVERDMVGSVSMETANLQLQLASIRSELGYCKSESLQVLSHFQGGCGLANGHNTHAMPAFDASLADDGAAAAAAAVMLNLSSMPDPPRLANKAVERVKGPGAGRGGKQRGSAAAAAAAPRSLMLDPAAAAALPVPADIIGIPTSTVPVALQPLMPFKSMTEARTLGMGQLMQVGPGKLVVGPMGWKPPLQPSPAAPASRPHTGGRHKRRRGHIARLASQKRIEQLGQVKPGSSQGQFATGLGSGTQGSAAAAGTDEDIDGDLGDEDSEEEDDPLGEQDDMDKDNPPHLGAQPSGRLHGVGGGSWDATGAAAAPVSKRLGHHVRYAGNSSTGVVATQGGKQLQSQQHEHQHQQLHPESAPGSRTASHTRSPTPDKCQQTDQDSSNSSIAGKKRKLDSTKAAVATDGSLVLPTDGSAQQVNETRYAGVPVAILAELAAGRPTAQEYVQPQAAAQKRQAHVGPAAPAGMQERGNPDSLPPLSSTAAAPRSALAAPSAVQAMRPAVMVIGRSEAATGGSAGCLPQTKRLTSGTFSLGPAIIKQGTR